MPKEVTTVYKQIWWYFISKILPSLLKNQSSCTSIFMKNKGFFGQLNNYMLCIIKYFSYFILLKQNPNNLQ